MYFEQLLDSDNNENGILILNNYIKLEKGISQTNFMMAQAHNMLYAFVFFVMEVIKVKILQNNDRFNYDLNEASKIISLLFLQETIIKFVAHPIIGYYIDKIGRQKVALYGYILLIINLFGITLTSNIYIFSIFWGLYIIGIVSLVSIPFIGDYVDDSYKGKGIGIQYVVTTLAGVIAGSYSYILNSYSLNVSIYGIICCCIGSTVGSFLYLKPGLYHLHHNHNQIQQNEHILRIILNEGWLIIASIMSVVGGCQANLVSTFVVMWTKSFYPQNLQTEADARANQLLIITYTAVFMFAIVIGTALDKIKTIHIYNFTHLMMGLGAFLIIIVNNIFSLSIYICFLILGIGIAGQIIINNYLLFKYSTGQTRGQIYGITSMISALGGCIINFLGSYLFAYSRGIPFGIYGIIVIATYIFSIYVYYKFVNKY